MHGGAWSPLLRYVIPLAWSSCWPRSRVSRGPRRSPLVALSLGPRVAPEVERGWLVTGSCEFNPRLLLTSWLSHSAVGV